MATWSDLTYQDATKLVNVYKFIGYHAHMVKQELLTYRDGHKTQFYKVIVSKKK